jgi:hypothetical protein
VRRHLLLAFAPPLSYEFVADSTVLEPGACERFPAEVQNQLAVDLGGQNVESIRVGQPVLHPCLLITAVL